MAAALRESKPLCLKPLVFQTFAPTQVYLGSIFKNKSNSFIIKNSSQLLRRSSSTSSYVIRTVEGFRNSSYNSNNYKMMKYIQEDEEEEVKERKGINPLEGIVEAILKSLKALKKPAVAVVLLVVLLTYNNHSAALAASGGRVGGWASDSSSSWGSSSSSSSSSWNSSPSCFSSSCYSSGSYSSGSRDSSDQKKSRDSSEPLKVDPFWTAIFLSVLVLFLVYLVWLILTSKKTVLKLQVGLLGAPRSLQKELDKIAEAADTSTPKGLNTVLKETTSALLRYSDYWISGYSHVDVMAEEDGKTSLVKHFNQLSMEERAKFDEETLVNVNNVKRKRTSTSKATNNGLSNEYIVTTILVAASGLVKKLPAISSSADLKNALVKLGSITADNTMAVEVLWTPQKENDTLTELEFLENYPLLKPLQG